MILAGAVLGLASGAVAGPDRSAEVAIDADARIGDFDNCYIPLGVTANRDSTTVRSIFDRIVDQIA